MSKYDKVEYTNVETNPLVDGEKELWSGKPNKKAFMINQIVTMAPFAIVWLAFDSFFIYMLVTGFMESGDNMGWLALFLVPFFALHLMPVWIWLSQIITANKKWQNTKYYITDKRIIIKNGFFAENFQTFYYKDIKNVNLSVGLLDKILGVGDIHLDLSEGGAGILDIDNPMEVYPKIQKIVLDIQTDMEFPNAYRPEENPGYKTKYKV